MKKISSAFALLCCMTGTCVVACSGGATQNPLGASTGVTPSVRPTPVATQGVTPPAVALQGCTTAHYDVPIKVGDQNFTVLLDSGSGTLAVVREGCIECGGITPLYNPGASATDTGETTEMAYGSGSVNFSAEVYTDQVYLPGITGPCDMRFGAISNSNNFLHPVTCVLGGPATHPRQGIIGVGGGVGPNTDQALIVAAAAGKLDDVFATQLCTSGGNAWFGGYDTNLFPGQPMYTPITAASQAHGGFAVSVSDLGIGGNLLGLSSSDLPEIVMDTGTGPMVLPSSVFEAFTRQMNSSHAFVTAFGADFFSNGACMSDSAGMTTATLDQTLPALTIEFVSTDSSAAGPSISAPATSSYLIPTPTADGNIMYCPGVIDGGASAILGSGMMRGSLVIFDRKNERVGFLPQNMCD